LSDQASNVFSYQDASLGKAWPGYKRSTAAKALNIDFAQATWRNDCW